MSWQALVPLETDPPWRCSWDVCVSGSVYSDCLAWPEAIPAAPFRAQLLLGLILHRRAGGCVRMAATTSCAHLPPAGRHCASARCAAAAPPVGATLPPRSAALHMLHVLHMLHICLLCCGVLHLHVHRFGWSA